MLLGEHLFEQVATETQLDSEWFLLPALRLIDLTGEVHLGPFHLYDI